MNRNIKISHPLKISGIFCGLFLIISFFVKGSSANSERIQSLSFNTSQQTTGNRIFQGWDSTLPGDFSSILSSVEETDSTDESTGDETGESVFPLHISCFYYNFSKSSFVNFNLSLQKRITIPFFLLHHSLKIPFA